MTTVDLEDIGRVLEEVTRQNLKEEGRQDKDSKDSKESATTHLSERAQKLLKAKKKGKKLHSKRR
jgi:hypothetical protein